MAKAKKTKKEPAPADPKVVMEITIQAMDDANVSLTFPEKSNVWVLRGILAKALATLNQVTVTPEAQQEPN